MARRTDYSAPALEKGMDILELLAEVESGLTVSEISLSLKRRMSELFRIIVVMQQRGWLQKDPESSRYSVSYLVLRLAHRGTPAQSLTAAAAPVACCWAAMPRKSSAPHRCRCCWCARRHGTTRHSRATRLPILRTQEPCAG